MRMRAAQSCELILTRHVMQERTKWDDHQREPFVERERTHIAGMRGNSTSHVCRQLQDLLAQPIEHARIQIHGCHSNTSLGDRNSHTPRTRTELEYGPTGFNGFLAIPLHVA